MKKRKLKKSIKGKLIIIVFIFIVCFIYTKLKPKENTLLVNEPVDSSVNEDDEPYISNGDELMDKLYLLSKKDKRIKTIIKNQDSYPRDLLKMLSKNIDLTDFVLKFNENKGKVFADNIGKVKKGEYPLLLQYDKRWGYGYYGDLVVATDGCGPTVISMVVAGLTGRNDVTPYTVATYAEENGFFDKEIGTSWRIMTEGIHEYGIYSKELPLDKNIMINELEQNHPIVLCMGPGEFTDAGHFILITDVKNGKFVVNDPNSIERSKKLWSYEQIEDQIRNLWAFYT